MVPRGVGGIVERIVDHGLWLGYRFWLLEYPNDPRRLLLWPGIQRDGHLWRKKRLVHAVEGRVGCDVCSSGVPPNHLY